MNERAKPPYEYPEYGQRILDYFFSYPSGQEKRDQYLERGLIPTNNLSLYITNDDKPEYASGRRNPYYYAPMPFGGVMERFKNNHPALWEQARHIAETSADTMSAFTGLTLEGKREDVELAQARVEELYWKKATIYDQIIRMLAPELEAVGIDPLEVCK